MNGHSPGWTSSFFNNLFPALLILPWEHVSRWITVNGKLLVGILTSIISSLTLTTSRIRDAPRSDILKFPPKKSLLRPLQGKEDLLGQAAIGDGRAKSVQGSGNLQRPSSVIRFLIKTSFSRVVLCFRESPIFEKSPSSRSFCDKSSSRKDLISRLFI